MSVSEVINNERFYWFWILAHINTEQTQTFIAFVHIQAFKHIQEYLSNGIYSSAFIIIDFNRIIILIDFQEIGLCTKI